MERATGQAERSQRRRLKQLPVLSRTRMMHAGRSHNNPKPRLLFRLICRAPIAILMAVVAAPATIPLVIQIFLLPAAGRLTKQASPASISVHAILIGVCLCSHFEDASAWIWILR